VVIAHPVSVILGLLAFRVQKVRQIRRMNATVFEPASEFGRRGMDELHDQTVNLLSFQQLPTNVFGTQVAFSLGNTYGEGITPSLKATEARIFDHFKRLTSGRLPVPSLMLLHAPVFHGHMLSVYIELTSPLDVAELQAALSGDGIEIAHSDEDAPSNVNVAGAEQIQIAVRADESNPEGAWLWVAADSLRIAATMAVNCAEEMLATRPRGQVQ
jgi:aspartate-semialdehyde dehydrogenase